MAEEGTLRNFLDKYLSIKDDNVLDPTGTTGDKSMEIAPDKAMSGISQAKDPRVITDDSGKIVDYDTNDPISKALKGIIPNNFGKRSEPGTLSGAIFSLLNPDRARNQGGFASPGEARSEELLGIPNKNVSPSTLAPTVQEKPKNYALSGLDAPSIQELRASLYKQTGQGAPPLATANQDPNGLAGRMNSPYANAEMQDQKKQAQDISAMFRPKTAGPIERPQKRSDLNNPFRVAGDYIGDLPYRADGPPELGIAIGRRDENGNVIRSQDPNVIMKARPDDEEGYTHPNNPFLWIRKKKPGHGNEGPLTS
jgi:hypothetical protein